MSTLPAARSYTRWRLSPVPGPRSLEYEEVANVPFILETLRTDAEIARVGRQRFPGTVAQKNALWSQYRNYLLQALSNFEAAQSVPNRSSALLYYYSMLNFAKAELMNSHASRLVHKRIGHGLSFSPTNARTVSGDVLKVVDGVFPLLYERRTGHKLVEKSTLPVNRLLLQVPEIGSQLLDVDFGQVRIGGIVQLVAMDGTHAWVLLAVIGLGALEAARQDVSRKLFMKHFEPVQPPPEWQDHFAFSRRANWPFDFFESRVKVPLEGGTDLPLAAFKLLEPIKSILGMSTVEQYDAFLVPSLYSSRLLPMPPSLARYALTYYASSLVRYKPEMFDPRSFPEQAYLFDAIARELALPMLQDVLAAIRGEPVTFRSPSSYRS